ncbi:MAG: aldo/keto reductase [Muribaculaceae bacterium]|jgi:L-glyceraldehyde 3-phosphate reductase|nr:aldo/keto reductase [Muribaculaceae bacterium]
MEYKKIYTPDPDRYDGRMTYRRCGNSGITLSEISLGFWWNFGGINVYQDSLAKMTYAFDHGVTVYDLANNYGPPFGSAEETFGRMYSENFTAHRHEMIITTKAGYEMWEGPYGRGSSRKMLMTSLDESLKRMKLDYVDIFYTHRYDSTTPVEETMQALIDIVHSGKALYVGLSNYPAEVLTQCIALLREQHVNPLIYQGKYNLLVRDLENTHRAIFNKEKIGFTAFSPIAQGMLSNKYLNGIPADSRAALGRHLNPESITPEIVEKLNKLNTMAMKRGQSLAQMAIAWLLSKPRVTSVIIGPRTVEQLADSLKATENKSFTTKEIADIDEIMK